MLMEFKIINENFVINSLFSSFFLHVFSSRFFMFFLTSQESRKNITKNGYNPTIAWCSRIRALSVEKRWEDIYVRRGRNYVPSSFIMNSNFNYGSTKNNFQQQKHKKNIQQQKHHKQLSASETQKTTFNNRNTINNFQQLSTPKTSFNNGNTKNSFQQQKHQKQLSTKETPKKNFQQRKHQKQLSTTETPKTTFNNENTKKRVNSSICEPVDTKTTETAILILRDRPFNNGNTKNNFQQRKHQKQLSTTETP